ncbi:MAG: acyltransferase family protein, partial [Paracoccaceae bacterium]
MTRPPAGTRFALIEAIRGLAAILVVWSHSVDKSHPFYVTYFDPGKIGVVIFFFISGYLVIPSAARDGAAGRFLIKRLFRLYPLYWLSLAWAFMLWPGELSPAGWIANLTMAQQLLGFDNAIDVYWTLTIEFCLYVIVTACLILAPHLLRQRFDLFMVGFAALCLAAAAARWQLQAKVPVAIPLGLFCMFVGAQLRGRVDAGQGVWGTALIYAAVVIPSCLLAYSFSTGFDETPTRYVVTYLAGGGVFLALLFNPDLDLGRVPRV